MISLFTQALLCACFYAHLPRLGSHHQSLWQIKISPAHKQTTKCSTWNLIYSCFILKSSCLMAEGWLKPNPNRSNIAWISFDLQEHKIHNNVSLVMEHIKPKIVEFHIVCKNYHFFRTKRDFFWSFELNNLLNWIIYWIESQRFILNWIIYWIES